MAARLLLGDCLEVMKTMEASSVDAVVTDPPAGIGFMGKEWDDFRRSRNEADTNRENVFGRTSKKGPQYGRRGRRQSWQYPISDHGFTDGGDRLPAPNIGRSSLNPTCQKCGRRQRTWKTGPTACDCPSPEFNDHAAHLDARETFVAFMVAVFSEVLRVLKPGSYGLVWSIPRTSHWTATALEDAGFEVRDRIAHIFGTGFPKGKGCLKPAVEDWWLVRKPGKGVKALGIDECRIGTSGGSTIPSGMDRYNASLAKQGYRPSEYQQGEPDPPPPSGRWPANLILSHSDGCNGVCVDGCPVKELDEQSGESQTGGNVKPYVRATRDQYSGGFPDNTSTFTRDTGGASRFFYTAKASKADRGEGNTHPTVKSTALMSWLIKLVCHEGGTVLDPFAGSGSTLVACLRTGREGIGIEISEEYNAIAQRRIAAAQSETPLFAHAD